MISGSKCVVKEHIKHAFLAALLILIRPVHSLVGDSMAESNYSSSIQLHTSIYKLIDSH
uniref:Uncharacterized protein n=1 Tax=Arundo donax TaxID=35708 RepID=A0A0A9E8V6_ARUDO